MGAPSLKVSQMKEAYWGPHGSPCHVTRQLLKGTAEPEQRITAADMASAVCSREAWEQRATTMPFLVTAFGLCVSLGARILQQEAHMCFGAFSTGCFTLKRGLGTPPVTASPCHLLETASSGRLPQPHDNQQPCNAVRHSETGGPRKSLT